MASNLQMRLILYLVLTYCSVCVKSDSYVENDDEKLVRAYIGGSSSERQFISQLRKWIFGRGDEKKEPQSKTKVKYLPIYVPVPIYSGTKVPSAGSEYYGAYQQKDKEVQEESDIKVQVPSKPSLPYPHSENYDLPFGGQLYQVLNRQTPPFYYMPNGEQLPKPAEMGAPSSYHTPYYGAYDYIYDNSYGTATYPEPEQNNYDSVVIDNPELITDPNEERRQDRSRKRKKYRKKTI